MQGAEIWLPFKKMKKIKIKYPGLHTWDKEENLDFATQMLLFPI